jgi:hypothetical protein
VRKVEVDYSNHGDIGYFHGWQTVYDVESKTAFVLAVVEFNNGRCDAIPIEHVKFVGIPKGEN